MIQIVPSDDRWGLLGEQLGAGIGQGFAKGQQQKELANLYGSIADFGNNLNNLDMGGRTSIQDLASRNNPNSNYMGANVERNTISGMKQQGLLTNRDFLGQNQRQPTAETLGQGLLSGMKKQNALVTSVNQGYSFTNPLTETNPNNQYSQANNPAKVETSMPLSVAQAKTQLFSSIPLAAKELAERGHDPRVFMPLIQQMVQDRLGEYTEQYNQTKAGTLMQQFNASANPYQKAVIAAQMKQYGIAIDPKMISTLSPEYKMEVVDQGPQKSLVLYNPKTGEVASGGTLGVGVSPNTQYTQQNENLRWSTPSANNVNDNNTRLTTAQIGAASRGNRGGRSGGTGKTGTGMAYSQYEKANKRYDEILQDIWDSPSAQSRTGKKNSYKDELNTLGQLLDKDVNNDVSYIPTGWVDPKGGGI